MAKAFRHLILITACLAIIAVLQCGEPAYAAGYSQDDYRLIYETEELTLHDMPITQYNPSDGGYYEFSVRPIKLEFYDSTLQKVQGVYTSELGSCTDSDGNVHSNVQVISGVRLIRNHNYMVSALDTEYVMPQYYIRLDEDGNYPMDIKSEDLERYDVFSIAKLTTPFENETDSKRVSHNGKIMVIDARDENMPAALAGVTVRLISPLETVEAVSDEGGYLNVSLIEDNNYIVQLVDPDNRFAIASFPLTVKDHSENPELESQFQKWTYNHFSCGAVNYLYVIDKRDEHAEDTVMVSMSGKTSVTGMNFLNDRPTDTDHYFINDRSLDKNSVSGLAGKDYEVFAVEAINMFRTEMSRLAAGDFVITRDVPKGKSVAKVYYADDSGKLVNLDFAEKSGKVSFTMHTLSIYPNVIVYKDAETKGKDGTALGQGASASLADKAVRAIGTKSDKDPKGTVFGKLRLRSLRQAKNSVTVTWAKTGSAKKYVLYGNLCGKGKGMKKICTTAKTSMVVKKTAGRNLKAGKYYKFVVVALDAKNKVVSTSKVIHVATKGGKAGNYAKVTTKAKKGKLSLKKGKKFKLGAKQVPAAKNLKVSKHASIRYESSDSKIAVVSSSGVVTAKKKGSCYIYAYTQSGTYSRIKVTVR